MTSEGFIEDNTLAQVKTPKETMRAVTPLTPDEVSKILKIIPRNNHKGYRDSSIIIALYGTLLRINELLELPVSNVDFSSGQIKVTGKGDRERSIFLSPKAYKALYKYYSHWRPEVSSNYLFVHEDGRKLDRFYFSHRMQVYVRKANISKPCTPHLLRYSGSIQMLRSGCDPYTLQKILGHTTMDMTRRYLKIANSDVEKQMKSYSPAERLDIRL
jgi:integrase/recombinase XerD